MIHYVRGDATKPVGTGLKIIVHSCNDLGAWGSGFVLAVSKRWKEPEARYRAWFKEKYPALGEVQFVSVADDVIVANMIGQQGLVGPKNPHPAKYDAFRTGLSTVAEMARGSAATVHMPRIGCGLGGATWEKVEAIINEVMQGVQVTVYDL